MNTGVTASRHGVELIPAGEISDMISQTIEELKDMGYRHFMKIGCVYDIFEREGSNQQIVTELVNQAGNGTGYIVREALDKSTITDIAKYMWPERKYEQSAFKD